MSDEPLTIDGVFESIRREDGCPPDCCSWHVEAWGLLVAEVNRLRAQRDDLQARNTELVEQRRAAVAAKDRAIIQATEDERLLYVEITKTEAAAANAKEAEMKLSRIERMCDGTLRTMAVEIGKIADAERGVWQCILEMVRGKQA